jgi:PAS domain S-box-containing protein
MPSGAGGRDADSALRHSQRLLRAISDNSEAVIYAKDTGGRYLFVNRRFGELFGVAPEEMLGRSDFDLFTPERAEVFRDMDRRVALAGTAETAEELVPLADGLHTYLSVKAPLRDDTGHVYAVFGISTDITERKRMEQALVESQQHYRALAESLPNLVWTCRPDGYCDFLSRQWVEYTGRPAEEQIGYGWTEHVHPEDRSRVQAEWEAATQRGDIYEIEFRLRRGDGAYRWFHTRAVPHRDDEGRIVKWFGTNTDFEDVKQTQQRLQAKVERLNLLDQLTRAIGERQDLASVLQVVADRLEEQLPADFSCACLHDPTEQVLTVAHVGARSGRLAAELGLSGRTAIPVDANGLSQCVHGRLVHESTLAGIPYPFPQRLARGGLRSLVAAPLAVDGRVFGVLIVGRRTSPGFSSGECEFLRQLSDHVALAARQAQLYAALQEAYEDLRQTQQVVAQQERLKALGQMASGIAHDINNAITPLGLCTELLLDTEPNLSDEARATLAMMQHAIDDVAHTVAGLREFYRERDATPALGTVDLNALVGEVVNLTRARWSDMPQQRGVAITVSTELASGPATLRGVGSELRQALINLLFNAVDALPDGGAITVRTRRVAAASAEHVVLEVADDGVGMSPDVRQRCLEPFFTTKGERGSGLGLSMVYGVVQRHGGEIEIDSAPGRGTAVRVSLPVRNAAAAAVALPESRRATGLRLLVIDDDPMLLSTLRSALEVDRHVVTTADGGQAGIDAFVQAHRAGAPFDAVITDLGMPYVDGRKVASAIKSEVPATPLIMLTGWGQRMLDDRDVPSCVDRVLAKPPRLADLRGALAELTRHG